MPPASLGSETIDGFVPEQHEAFVSFRPEAADRAYEWTDRIGKRLGVEVDGLENIPRGRALLVANHTFGPDVVFPMSAVWHRMKRPVWVLGEHAWWHVPYVRRWAAAVGVVDGTPDNVDRLLDRDQLVLVLPGGLRESVKPRELRYQLLWGNRYGFVEAAIRNRTPIVPLACVGADDLFDLVGDAFARGRRWLGRPGFPIPRPSHLLAIPHFTPLRFIVGEPIDVRAEPNQAQDPSTLHRIRREVAGALHELIENELARRLGIALG